MLAQKVSEASFVVTISNYNKEFILEKCGADDGEKVLVIHCGVDTQFYQPAPLDDLSGPPDRPFAILCIGTMYEVKGHTYLIEACRLLQERGLDFICHLVGDGPDRESLIDQVTQAGLVERVRFHGQLRRPEIAQLYRMVHVLSVPSIPTESGRREGIPVVLMEAMSSGVPVVAAVFRVSRVSRTSKVVSGSTRT
jgi:glycosyltransferase involved in cell wall biosynthesis